jgi:hypothetical protein
MPIERALPDVGQPRRATTRLSILLPRPGSLLGQETGLDRHVAQAVAACSACAARIRELEAAVKLCVLLCMPANCTFMIMVSMHV